MMLFLHKKLGVVFFLSSQLLVISGCDSSNVKAIATNNQSLQMGDIPTTMATHASDTTINTGLVHDEAKILKDKTIQQDAYYASKTNFICPKLVNKPVDAIRIKRRNEIMQSNYCEYYLYPKIGESVQVISADSRLEKWLVTPYMHNFDNGAYKVVKNDRHTVRLSYNGMENKPDLFKYDIEIVIK